MRSAIPTTYAGIRFRSRLEATWAAFFTAVNWPWEYEPLDYDGYIPDFLLTLGRGQVLVEVKPGTTIEGLLEWSDKCVDAIGDDFPLVIVGAMLFQSDDLNDFTAIGQMSEIGCPCGGPPWKGGCAYGCEETLTRQEFSECQLGVCKHGVSFVCSDGNGTGLSSCGDGCRVAPQSFSSLWAKAKNASQWRGK